MGICNSTASTMKWHLQHFIFDDQSIVVKRSWSAYRKHVIYVDQDFKRRAIALEGHYLSGLRQTQPLKATNIRNIIVPLIWASTCYKKDENMLY